MAGSPQTSRRSLASGAAPRSAIVVGGGIAGLACARRLFERGVGLVVIEKARGVGGRMATRYAETCTFDHGAQYFTVRDPGFGAVVDDLVERGVVARWEGVEFELTDAGFAPRGRREPRFVGVPGNNRVGQELGRTLPVQLHARVADVVLDAGGWTARLEDDRVVGPADAVVLAMPATQARALVRDPSIAARLDRVGTDPCWAVMATYDELVEVPWDAVVVRLEEAGERCPIAWVARNATKPKRTVPSGWESLVIHARGDWSRAHLEDDPDAVAAAIRAALDRHVVAGLPEPQRLRAHRWRYARTTSPLGEPCLWAPGTGMGLCGDWCLGARVEEAWRSGHALAGRMLGVD